MALDYRESNDYTALNVIKCVSAVVLTAIGLSRVQRLHGVKCN